MHVGGQALACAQQRAARHVAFVPSARAVAPRVRCTARRLTITTATATGSARQLPCRPPRQLPRCPPCLVCVVKDLVGLGGVAADKSRREEHLPARRREVWHERSREPLAQRTEEFAELDVWADLPSK